MNQRPPVLLIDNDDSFTRTLVPSIGDRGVACDIRRDGARLHPESTASQHRPAIAGTFARLAAPGEAAAQAA